MADGSGQPQPSPDVVESVLLPEITPFIKSSSDNASVAVGVAGGLSANPSASEGPVAHALPANVSIASRAPSPNALVTVSSRPEAPAVLASALNFLRGPRVKAGVSWGSVGVDIPCIANGGAGSSSTAGSSHLLYRGKAAGMAVRLADSAHSSEVTDEMLLCCACCVPHVINGFLCKDGLFDIVNKFNGRPQLFFRLCAADIFFNIIISCACTPSDAQGGLVEIYI